MYKQKGRNASKQFRPLKTNYNMANLENNSGLQALLPIHGIDRGKATISARALYEFLGLNKSRWSKWYKSNIQDNPYMKEGEDWNPLVLGSNANGSSNMDFEITLDFGKRISMMAKTEKGELARNYFLECERKALAAIAPTHPLSILELMQASVNFHIEQQNKNKEIDNTLAAQQEQIEMLKAKTITSENDYFAIVGYASLTHKKVLLSDAIILGKRATSLCKHMGFITGIIPDPRFGKVKTYPKEVLITVFDEYFKPKND